MRSCFGSSTLGIEDRESSQHFTLGSAVDARFGKGNISGSTAILFSENGDVASMNPMATQKEGVREFWNADPCGARYLEGKDDFEAHARSRYALEPYIADFAQFQKASFMCARQQ